MLHINRDHRASCQYLAIQSVTTKSPHNPRALRLIDWTGLGVNLGRTLVKGEDIKMGKCSPIYWQVPVQMRQGGELYHPPLIPVLSKCAIPPFLHLVHPPSPGGGEGPPLQALPHLPWGLLPPSQAGRPPPRPLHNPLSCSRPPSSPSHVPTKTSQDPAETPHPLPLPTPCQETSQVSVLSVRLWGPVRGNQSHDQSSQDIPLNDMCPNKYDNV